MRYHLLESNTARYGIDVGDSPGLKCWEPIFDGDTALVTTYHARYKAVLFNTIFDHGIDSYTFIQPLSLQ